MGSPDQNVNNTEQLSNQEECSSISKTAEGPLLFGVFTFANDTESMKIMREQYSNNEGRQYVMHSIRSLSEGLWLYDEFPTHRNMIIVQSLDNITSALDIDRYYDLNIIAYDIEQWEKTPELERMDPLLSISRGAGIVHQAGYRYGITPDAAMLMENYKKINWTEIASFARCKNPNIEIFTQLSFRLTDANDMIKVIERVKDMVDGFIIAYDTNTRADSCISGCSANQLNLVLDRINRLR